MTKPNYEQILLDLCESGDAKFDAISNKSKAYPQHLEICVRSFAENAAAFILNLHAQWGNGGIQQYFDNQYYVSDWKYLRIILEMIGTEAACRVIAMVEKAAKIYLNADLGNLDDYDCEDDHHVALAVLDRLDIEYYAMEGRLLQDTVEWLGTIDHNE